MLIICAYPFVKGMAQRPLIEHFSGSYPLPRFRARVSQITTPYVCVVRLKKDLPQKTGWQYTTPSGDIISPKKGAKGVLKFLTPLLRKDTAPLIPTGMSRNATYPHGANHSSLITVPNKGMPRNRASLCVLSLNLTSLLTFVRILLFPFFQFLLPLFTRV